MTTTSTLMQEWADAPQPGRRSDEWPYPTRYSKSLITGDLADKIRERLGVEAHVPVMITETIESGGYSEYTQENDYSHTINVGEHVIEIRSGWTRSGITALINWLERSSDSEEVAS